jgi:hypothetical protein
MLAWLALLPFCLRRFEHYPLVLVSAHVVDSQTIANTVCENIALSHKLPRWRILGLV